MNRRSGEFGVITDIQKYSVHDGPGIRTVVFFKGCPLRCRWCSNPETNSVKRNVMYTVNQCIGCGKCENVCPKQAIRLTRSGVQIDDAKCVCCGMCVDHCYAGALKIMGRTVTSEEVMREIRQDSVFYKNSGGGITLSGGECTMQPEFAAELLSGAHKSGFNTAVETCGYCGWEAFEKILPYTDFLLFDLKHSDSAEHARYTGCLLYTSRCV